MAKPKPQTVRTHDLMPPAFLEGWWWQASGGVPIQASTEELTAYVGWNNALLRAIAASKSKKQKARMKAAPNSLKLKSILDPIEFFGVPVTWSGK